MGYSSAYINFPSVMKLLFEKRQLRYALEAYALNMLLLYPAISMKPKLNTRIWV